MNDQFSYVGKRVAIAGCYSGIGEACARGLVALGAEVHGVDVKPSTVAMASFTQVDLDDWASIDAGVASIGGRIDALFNCAGVSHTFAAAKIVGINFLGIRHWTEQWLPRMGQGGAIVTVSSLAGMAYRTKLDFLKSVIACADRVAVMDLVEANPGLVGDVYGFTKELLNAWTSMQAVELAPRGIRINATMPGPTRTPMMTDFEKVVGPLKLGSIIEPTGRCATAEEQAGPLVLLNTGAASFVSGALLPVDGGFYGGMGAGLIDRDAGQEEYLASLSGPDG
jgi:NAD(P)-dependent dehydrogenase (short-subunit alcohol dehydrogenase family)